jgi:hypothetical protein
MEYDFGDIHAKLFRYFRVSLNSENLVVVMDTVRILARNCIVPLSVAAQNVWRRKPTPFLVNFCELRCNSKEVTQFHSADQQLACEEENGVTFKLR